MKGALSGIGLVPPPGATLPMAAEWQNEHGARVALQQAIGGRPALVIFADYTCSTLCGPVLGVVGDALAHTSLRPGRDYRLVLLGLDAKDSAADAARMREAQLAAPLVSAATFLRADAATIENTTRAVGYNFAYDAGTDQFAHPAAVLVVTAAGRVTRVLSGLGLTANDLGLALVEAGKGRIGTLGQRIRLMCYGFDPSEGVYSLSIWRATRLAGAGTAIALAGLVLVLSLRSRRRGL
jgi:protein SCO1/2